MKLLNNKILNKWILFITMLIGYLIFDVIYIIVGIDFNKITINTYLLLSFIKYAFFMILLIVIHRKYLKEKLHDFKLNFKKYISISLKDWFTGLLIMFTTNLIINRFFTGLGENEETVQSLISTAPIAAIFMTTFFAPFNEEMIFRKNLQDICKNNYIFMLASGLIFGLVHVIGSTNPFEYLLIISYGALGFMFAHTLYKTDNIYCTIMMHMLHNGILTLLSVVI